jgi:hypothetical protein
MTVVLGVDPGLSGAFAWWDGEALYALDIPTTKAKKGRDVDWDRLVALAGDIINLFGTDYAYIEQVSSRPAYGKQGKHQQGVASAFKFGYVAGGMRGIIAARHVPVKMVPPNIWKMSMQVSADKRQCVDKACELFPYHTSMFFGPKGGLNDGVAEAALIAWYGLDQLRRGEKK